MLIKWSCHVSFWCPSEFMMSRVAEKCMFMWRFFWRVTHTFSSTFLNVCLLYLPPPLPSSPQNRLKQFVEVILDFNSELELSTDIRTFSGLYSGSVWRGFFWWWGNARFQLRVSLESPVWPRTEKKKCYLCQTCFLLFWLRMKCSERFNKDTSVDGCFCLLASAAIWLKLPQHH